MIILVGASASGKSVLVKKLIEKYNMEKVVTYTTRSMRIGEINNIDYHFIDLNSFIMKKDNNFFLETAFYNNNYYGTAYEDISKNKVLILEPSGANIYYDKLKDDVFIVYLQASENERKKRMYERGDSEEAINKRLLNDVQYFAVNNFKKIDIIVETENKSVDEIAKIVYNSYISYLKK